MINYIYFIYLKILRAKIVKYRLGTTEPTTPERKPLTANERDALIEELEKSHLEVIYSTFCRNFEI